MKRTLALLAAGVAGALVALLALTFAGGAFAQGPGGEAVQPSAVAGARTGGRMGGGRMGGAESLVGMAATELGITQADLVAKLGTDGTIAAVLKAGGVDPAAFIDRFVASRAARLDAAVAAGTMSREEANGQLALARSMATARIAQPFTRLGPGGQGQGAGGRGQGAGQGFVDTDGDGVCDQMPAGGGQMGRGPRR